MAGDLMARVVDGADQARVPISDLAEHKESRRRVSLCELVQNPVRGRSNALAIVGLEIGIYSEARGGLNNVVIFHVETQDDLELPIGGRYARFPPPGGSLAR
jgi:hypothetical protein